MNELSRNEIMDKMDKLINQIANFGYSMSHEEIIAVNQQIESYRDELKSRSFTEYKSTLSMQTSDPELLDEPGPEFSE